MENQVLNKLVDSFDEFKQMLIRLDENVKDLKSVKTDVDSMKIELAQTKEAVKSMHKRLDTIENGDIKEIKNNQTWLWRTTVGGLIMGGIGLLFFVVQAFIKLKGGA